MNYLPLTELFVDIDNYCKTQEALQSRIGPKKRTSRLSKSEIMTIVIFFHFSGFKTFKHFYKFLELYHKKDFPKLVSYNRFLELQQSILIDLASYLSSAFKKQSGLYFIDSTSLKVCHNRRINRNKVFKSLAERGKSTMGWFFGFKLHLIIDDLGNLVSVNITKGNVDDRKVLPEITKGLKGKIFGDKGYLGKKWFEKLYSKGLKLITETRKKMKPKILSLEERILLKKIFLIETVNDQLKNICTIDHTRHRSQTNFLVNLISGLAAYTHLPKKPSISWSRKESLYLKRV